MAARSPIFLDRSSITVGADPEFFLKSGEEYISAHGYPCGTKDRPRQTQHGHVQVDGIALELNVRPASDRRNFILNLRGVVHDLDEIVQVWGAGKAFLVAEPVVPFSLEKLSALPESARALGCNPDFNAYTMAVNDTPECKTPIRTGAGHLHIGWGQDYEGMEHFEKCATLVKMLDYTVGLRTLLFDHEPRRRMLYGKAGAFRPKTYGCEYRVPSNAWCQSEELAGIMYDGVIQAIDLLNEGVDLDKETEGLARDCIDKNVIDWTTKYPKLADRLNI
jgi:hypothetical protein